MSLSTKVKSRDEIVNVRKLYEEDCLSIKGIARRCKYSVNTVRKILRRVYGYEGDVFNLSERWKNVGKEYSSSMFTSPVDGEKLHVQKSMNKGGYNRVSNKGLRETIHVHEAKKVFKVLGIEWDKRFVVHHVNCDGKDWSITNLSVFKSQALHLFYHRMIEKTLLEFMSKRGLLEDFYKEYPDLKIKTLKDMIE